MAVFEIKIRSTTKIDFKLFVK
jgi:hypothetical protein